MGLASTCACGNPSDSFGGLCDRCVALQTLGLSAHASQEQIENAYHMLVKVWHPDRFPSDPKLRLSAEEKLKEINAAHDYLVADPQMPQLATAPSKTQFVVTAQESLEVTAPEDSSDSGMPEDEPEEVRRIFRRQRRGTLPRLLLKAAFVVGTIAVAALIWLGADAILSSNQSTARAWDEYKTSLSRALHASAVRIWPGASDNSNGPKQQDQEPQAVPPNENSGSQVQQPKQTPHQAKSPERTTKALPYITAGLTPMEVLSVLGKPSSSSEEKMFYKGSEIDFKNGRVAGWKVDPKTAPIRVKLWPDTAPVQGITTFGVGSSKSDVIAVQGTPTLFSDNEFGYGGSVIFFQNNRVVSWKEDPSSVPLRVVAH